MRDRPYSDLTYWIPAMKSDPSLTLDLLFDWVSTYQIGKLASREWSRPTLDGAGDDAFALTVLLVAYVDATHQHIDPSALLRCTVAMEEGGGGPTPFDAVAFITAIRLESLLRLDIGERAYGFEDVRAAVNPSGDGPASKTMRGERWGAHDEMTRDEFVAVIERVAGFPQGSAYTNNAKASLRKMRRDPLKLSAPKFPAK